MIDILKDGQEEATAVIENVEQRDILLNDVQNIANENRNNLKDYWEAITVLFSLLQDYFDGKYKEVQKASIILIISSFLFIISPVRILPKWVPLGSFMERTLVIVFVLEYIKADLANYSEWKSQQVD